MLEPIVVTVPLMDNAALLVALAFLALTGIVSIVRWVLDVIP